MPTTTKTKPLAEAVCLIVEYAEKMGVKSIKDLPGAWFHQINDKWAVACNGQKTPQHVGPKDGMDIDLKPFHFAVWKNGWLFALMTPFDGQFMGTDHAGEDEFCEMMKEIIGDGK